MDKESNPIDQAFETFLSARVAHNPIPNTERWDFVIQIIPEIANNKIYHNHNKIFSLAYESNYPKETEKDKEEFNNNLVMLEALIEYAELKSDFYMYLIELGLNMVHINSYESICAAFWEGKLSDKYRSLKLNKKPEHNWIH